MKMDDTKSRLDELEKEEIYCNYLLNKMKTVDFQVESGLRDRLARSWMRYTALSESTTPLVIFTDHGICSAKTFEALTISLAILRAHVQNTTTEISAVELHTEMCNFVSAWNSFHCPQIGAYYGMVMEVTSKSMRTPAESDEMDIALAWHLIRGAARETLSTDAEKWFERIGDHFFTIGGYQTDDHLSDAKDREQVYLKSLLDFKYNTELDDTNVVEYVRKVYRCYARLSKLLEKQSDE